MATARGPKGTKRLGSMHEKGTRVPAGKDLRLPTQRWWTLKPEEIPGALRATIEQIRSQQTSFEQQRQVCARLYGGLLPGSFFGATGDRMHTIHPSLTGRLTYNVIAILVDSLVSKITKSKIRTLFQTEGGNYRQQRRAKKLSQFADGMAYEAKLDDKGPEQFRDGMILNEGILHVYEDWATGRVATERVIPTELYVDEIDGFYGTPTQIHRVKNVDREQLLEAFKDNKQAVEAIKNSHASDFDVGGHNGISDSIAVAESWRLPSGVEEDGTPTDDGRHMLWVEKGILTLPDEQVWRKKRFPFSVYRWKPAIYGWHGISLASELIGSQVEMNHLLIMFQRAFRLQAAFRIWLESGTVPDSHFTDRIGTILHGPRGSQPPQFLTPPAMNDQYFRHFESIKARAFEIARLSQLSAVGQKPAGLDSGEAQRVYHDIESEGFQYAGHLYEQAQLAPVIGIAPAQLDVTALQLDTVRDIFLREKKGYAVRAPVSSTTLPGQTFLRSIDWKGVNMEEDEYVLKCYPASSLPSTPQGKLATVQDLMKAGLIDAEAGRRLLDYPDLVQIQTLLGAAEDWIMSVLDKNIDGDEYAPPDPWMLLPMAEKLATQEFASAQANNADAKVIDRLRTFIQQVRDYKKVAAAAAAPPANPAGPGLPPGQGVPAPPPQSNLLPPQGTTPLAA